VLTRSTVGSTTTLTVYAYGLQEITYSGSGSETGQLDYYSIAGHLLGETNGSTTTYDLTDAQGTILLSLTSSAIQGEQIYDPYGNIRYASGTIGTDKGYTGQFDDAVTGLDYYNARWYDPVSGQFLSPDTVQGNAQGMDPYAYVGGNPETRVDPSGRMDSPDEELGGEAGNGGDDSSDADVALSENDAEMAEAADEATEAADTIESEDSLLQDEQRIDQQRTEQEHTEPTVEQSPEPTEHPSEPTEQSPDPAEPPSEPTEHPSGPTTSPSEPYRA
jgi:RHS repeat-associated protein